MELNMNPTINSTLMEQFAPSTNFVTEVTDQVADVTADKIFNYGTSFVDIRDQVNADSVNKVDEWIPESDVRVTSDLNLTNGYVLRESGLSCLRLFTDIPLKMAQWLRNNNHDADFAQYMNESLGNRGNTWDSKDGSEPRKFFVRTREVDGVKYVRAICSSRYGVIDNTDVVSLVSQSLPGGFLDAHAPYCAVTGDNLYANLVLPSYITSMDDSDYVVGVTILNSETRESAFKVLPYIYRVESDSGMVYARRETIIGVRKKHMGNIVLDSLQQEVKLAIDAALNNGKEYLIQLSHTKAVSVDDPLRLIASLARDNGLSIEQGLAWHLGYLEVIAESNSAGSIGKAIAIVNGLSRAATRFSDEERYSMETLAGFITAPNLSGNADSVLRMWNAYIQRASLLEDKIVKKYEATPTA